MASLGLPWSSKVAKNASPKSFSLLFSSLSKILDLLFFTVAVRIGHKVIPWVLVCRTCRFCALFPLFDSHPVFFNIEIFQEITRLSSSNNFFILISSVITFCLYAFLLLRLLLGLLVCLPLICFVLRALLGTRHMANRCWILLQGFSQKECFSFGSQ